MVEIAEIEFPADLSVWLDISPFKRDKLSRILAVRLALRTLPVLLADDITIKFDPNYSPTTAFWAAALGELRARGLADEVDVYPAADAIEYSSRTKFGTLFAGEAANALASAAYMPDLFDVIDSAYIAIKVIVRRPVSKHFGVSNAIEEISSESLVFSSVIDDVKWIVATDTIDQLMEQPLWLSRDNPLEDSWKSFSAAAPRPATGHSPETTRGVHPTGDWTFWIDWYQGVLDGKPMNPEMLLEIVQPQEGESVKEFRSLWQTEPKMINDRVMGVYRRFNPDGGTPLARAAVAEFEKPEGFDWMEMIGLPADLDHIRDPEAVQSFLDDIGDLQDRFQDFSDYTAELRGQRNIGGVLSQNSDKILGVLKHAADKDHLKARRLVELGGDLFYWSNEEGAREELGEGLCRQLDSALGRLKDVCQRHLGPSMEAMQALDRLELGDRSPQDWVAAIEAALVRIDGADLNSLVPLSPSARATLEDMLNELRLVAAAGEEARSEAWRDQSNKRAARTAGATSATIGKYIERGSQAAQVSGDKMDGVIKWFKRWKSMDDIWDWITKLLEGGAPPTP